MNEAVCPVCSHHCRIPDGAYGRCGARKNIGGEIVCANYGEITSLALDPIEKKPLSFFYPGSMILSVGSFGCNLACPFCQNHEIARAKETDFQQIYDVPPEELCRIAKEECARGNIGVAFTYNEPLVGYEYVRDAAALVRQAGMKNVLVTNGMVELTVLEELLPYMDAMNIDLKGFRPEIYQRLGGSLETVKEFIARAAMGCHVELTSLIVPGMNDSPEDMRAQAEWIARISPDIPLHITRYFPRYKMREPATDISRMKELKEIAECSLQYVCLGNV